MAGLFRNPNSSIEGEGATRGASPECQLTLGWPWGDLGLTVRAPHLSATRARLSLLTTAAELWVSWPWVDLGLILSKCSIAARPTAASPRNSSRCAKPADSVHSTLSVNSAVHPGSAQTVRTLKP
eukprot:1196068-Prorocentrum_minimum.AAC.2